MIFDNKKNKPIYKYIPRSRAQSTIQFSYIARRFIYIFCSNTRNHRLLYSVISLYFRIYNVPYMLAFKAKSKQQLQK